MQHRPHPRSRGFLDLKALASRLPRLLSWLKCSALTNSVRAQHMFLQSALVDQLVGLQHRQHGGPHFLLQQELKSSHLVADFQMVALQEVTCIPNFSK